MGVSDNTTTSTASEIIATALKVDVGQKVTQSGAISTVIFGLSFNELGVVVGIVIGVCGFAMQWHYRRKEYRLKELYYAKQGIRHDDEEMP